MWRPILYGCFASNGSAFDYDVIHQEQYTVARTLNALQMTTGMWVLGETDGRVFFGHHGLVGDFLGWDHTTAHDRIGRRVAFFLGYIGIQGSRLPGIRDLTSMAQQLQEDLRRLGEAARRARHPIGDAPEVELPHFQDRSGSASLWGRTLEEIEVGRRDIMVTLDQQGEQRLHDRARPVRARRS